MKAIVRHSYLQQKNPLRAGQQTLRNASTLTQNDNRASADSNEMDEADNKEYDSDAIDSGGEDDSHGVIVEFINSYEEDDSEKPNVTNSGRAITRRSEIDFSFFSFVIFSKAALYSIWVVSIVFIASTIRGKIR